MKVIKTFAPAKINLALHVTGQRADGYHLLDSLVMFADVGDRITLRQADETSFSVTGPMAAGVPTDARNLVPKVAALFDRPVAITLSKHLPSAAGIGGGSADAAATALAMCDLSETRQIPEAVMALGADIRVCLTRRAARMQGIGEKVTPLPSLPPLSLVLANPGLAMSTPATFAALHCKTNPPMPARLPKLNNTAAFIKWLAAQRNDLEAPAIQLQPVIGEVIAALSALPGAQLIRMSGSGATCFALFATRNEADHAAVILSEQKPGWWVRAASLT